MFDSTMTIYTVYTWTAEPLSYKIATCDLKLNVDN